MITIVTLIIHFFTRKSPIINPNVKRILISGARMTKALQLARSFYAAGHYVVLTDDYQFATHRFSRCVSRFRRSADITNSSLYIQSIIDIVQQEKIDVFVPVSNTCTERVEAHIKQLLLQFNCETFHGNVELLNMLSNKFLFINQVRALGLTAPKTYSITDPKQVLDFDFSKEQCQFILKSIVYNSTVRSHMIKLPCQTRQETIDYVNSLIINENYPWVMQEFIPGEEYCTHTTVRNGELRLHTCCKSSAYLLNYKHVNNKINILEWVREFCSRVNATGQVSFDFIESNEDGRPYAIECNPRTHTAILNFYNHSRVAEAYLDKEPLSNGPIQPRSDAREIYWLYYELWNLCRVKSIEDLLLILKRLLHGKEGIWSIDDPLPFFFQYTIHLPYVLIYSIYEQKPFNFIDCNLAFAH
ncbi:unnamed protein product [Adineta steineri]|uniref:ATP-grasp fold PylC-type domain-containing protein n=1 Tax=Adineta steineri TaxID=433720 RepID=A0A813TZG1_9BILA|nr:unnamed protein product [Adineta steineri]CAF3577019.1 unnamed protein product [Adineta steineri]